MPTYRIFKREIWVKETRIVADSLEEAVSQAEENLFREDCEEEENVFRFYTHTLDRKTWTAVDETGKFHFSVPKRETKYTRLRARLKKLFHEMSKANGKEY